MKLIDMHCDTIWKLMDLDREGDLMENHCCISIPSMRRAGTKAQFFACFTYLNDYLGADPAEISAGNIEAEKKQGYDLAWRHALEMMAYLKGEEQAYPREISVATSFVQMQRNAEEGRISAFLTVEEGGILNGSIERLKQLYEDGIRLVTLMWNYENCIGSPNSRDCDMMQQGLKPFGIDVVCRMNELGMIVDVSHASDGTFWDVLQYSRQPVVASHSNCRELCNHPRNLSDEMIRALAEKGGIAGVNFYGGFLGTPTESRVDEMQAHILHMIRVGGSEFPAIGTDFDGFDGMDRLEIPDASEMERLWESLKKAGVSERQLDKIWGANAERILKELL